jgi:cytochrome c oxidase subunit 1
MVAGALFAAYGAVYFWLPKWTGKMYDETLGQWHFWLTLVFFNLIFFVGTNIIFFPQHFLGLQGMPRRYVDYPASFAGWNKVSSIGYVIMAASMAVFAALLVEAAIRRRRGVANPWGEGATTLEWTLPSPPPYHQFNELPQMGGDRP